MLNTLNAVTTRKNKRVGRGPGSGKGKTAGKGHKGQKARSGKKFYVGFEGGQTRLAKRTPKLKGLRNLAKPASYVIVNLSQIAKIESETMITKEVLLQAGLIDSTAINVKLLGNGQVDRALTVSVDLVSESAKAKIEKAGGKIELL